MCLLVIWPITCLQLASERRSQDQAPPVSPEVGYPLNSVLELLGPPERRLKTAQSPVRRVVHHPARQVPVRAQFRGMRQGTASVWPDRLGPPIHSLICCRRPKERRLRQLSEWKAIAICRLCSNAAQRKSS
jgi:hypothetical protein